MVQTREKKPVAQILRKYREENEDGTITWGFENDDGSYKEEIIGIDCVTRFVHFYYLYIHLSLQRELILFSFAEDVMVTSIQMV